MNQVMIKFKRKLIFNSYIKFPSFGHLKASLYFEKREAF